MTELRDLYRELEGMEEYDILREIRLCTADILPMMRNDEIQEYRRFFACYLFTIVSADEDIAEQEFSLIKPLIDGILHMDCTLNDARVLLLGEDGFAEKSVRRHFSESVRRIRSFDSVLAR